MRRGGIKDDVVSGAVRRGDERGLGDQRGFGLAQEGAFVQAQQLDARDRKNQDEQADDEKNGPKPEPEHQSKLRR